MLRAPAAAVTPTVAKTLRRLRNVRTSWATSGGRPAGTSRSVVEGFMSFSRPFVLGSLLGRRRGSWLTACYPRPCHEQRQHRPSRQGSADRQRRYSSADGVV